MMQSILVFLAHCDRPIRPISLVWDEVKKSSLYLLIINTRSRRSHWFPNDSVEMDPQCFVRLTWRTDHEYPTRQRRQSVGACNRWSSRKQPPSFWCSPVVWFEWITTIKVASSWLLLHSRVDRYMTRVQPFSLRRNPTRVWSSFPFLLIRPKSGYELVQISDQEHTLYMWRPGDVSQSRIPREVPVLRPIA